MIDTHLKERHDKLTIIARSTKAPNGYLPYYWCKCDCGNVKRYRYDQARRKGTCGMCEDFTASKVLKELGSGKE